MPGWASVTWVRRLLGFLGPHGVLIALGTLVRIPQLFHSLNEQHAFRQTQTAMVARGFADGTIDLLHSPMPVFGRDADVPYEFPVVQAAAAVLIRLGLDADMAMRLVGLVSFQVSAVLLYFLVTRWHGRRVALIALALYQFSPFGLAWGAASLIEFAAVAAALAMVLGFDRWFTDRSWGWLAVGVVGSWLAPLIKITTAVPWYLLVMVCALVVLVRVGWRAAAGRVALAAAGAGAGLAAALAWTRYADGIKSRSPYTARLSSAGLQEWNFGTLRQRLNPENYAVISDRVLDEIVGPAIAFTVIGLVCAVAARRWPQMLPHRLGWVLVVVGAPMIFFNLYVVHNYYLTAVFAAWVVIAAFGIDFVARLLTNGTGSRTPAFFAGVVTAVVIAVTAVTSLGGKDLVQWLVGRDAPPVAAQIAAATGPDDAILMIGCEWDPRIAYYADRPALLLERPEGLVDDREVADYAFLYSCAPDLDPASRLPAGVKFEPTGVAGLYRLTHP